ncbi:nuclease harbi1 [Lasius niger]|uniref:Nuclease harbi1 n=1 Tax=Lasius niger TaxID=67767 RepID=A0A0J7K7A9_LASNI|nr:nuclease harbi1 [Lasius niger]
MADEMSADDVLSVVSSVIICSQVDIDEDDNEEDNDETSSLSSSSEEDSSDEESEMHTLYAMLMVNETRGETPQMEKLTDYVERVVPGYFRITFKEHFRVFPETFQIVLRLLRPALNATNARGRKQLSSEKQLMVTLWFMATPDSYRSVCVKFGVGKATALRAVRRVTYALHCLAPRFIKWPRGEEATRV